MPSHNSVYSFDRAIVRRPGQCVTQALRAVDHGDPRYDVIRSEHDSYVAALIAAGVDVTILSALEDYPDALFVEDPALVFSAGAIALRSCARTRAGEEQTLLPTLHEHFDTVLELAASGFADGGDVLVTPGCVLIGLSSRTDRAGADDLIGCLGKFGLQGRCVETPHDVLHLKSDCALLDHETILATARLAASDIFDGFDVIETPDGEEAAANALRVNDVVFVGDHFPHTIELLNKRGFQVTPLEVAEIGKIDAGLSCMSLRWQSARSD